jgi:hypothetical protein
MNSQLNGLAATLRANPDQLLCIPLRHLFHKRTNIMRFRRASELFREMIEIAENLKGNWA